MGSLRWLLDRSYHLVLLLAHVGNELPFRA
jgi:hypothetical protein